MTLACIKLTIPWQLYVARFNRTVARQAIIHIFNHTPQQWRHSAYHHSDSPTVAPLSISPLRLPNSGATQHITTQTPQQWRHSAYHHSNSPTVVPLSISPLRLPNSGATQHITTQTPQQWRHSTYHHSDSPTVAPLTVSPLPQLIFDVQILHVFILFGKLPILSRHLLISIAYDCG